jgi:RimJ/RimL family protein N-acetyltransferase
MSGGIGETMHDVKIRSTVRDDGPRLRELRLEALRLNPLAFTADLAEAEARPPEHWEDMAERGGIGPSRQVIIVAEAGSELVGMTGVWTAPQPKRAHIGGIWGVYVRPAARGRGIGEAMLKAAVDWARSQELRILQLGVTACNHSAKRCYERCGFTVYGVEPMAVCYEGQYYDEFLMACRL